jgi:hypothetical protein
MLVYSTSPVRVDIAPVIFQSNFGAVGPCLTWSRVYFGRGSVLLCLQRIWIGGSITRILGSRLSSTGIFRGVLF